LRTYLVSRLNWSKADEETIAGECELRVDAAIEDYLATTPRRPETMFDHLDARLPGVYAGQRREAAEQKDA
jgi:2-oxoisovalerate dehydrogenase E1 component alpha subunit